MNVLERAECLLDAGSSGNMNFTVIVRYRGCLEASALRSALATVQAEHLLLRSTVRWQGDHCRFVPTAAAVPVVLHPWPGDGPADRQAVDQAWKAVTMADLRQRFIGEGEPLWRLSWLRGANAGELLVTFHHAIADGLSAMALVQRLFTLLAAAEAGVAPPRSHDWDAQHPDLHRTFAGSATGPVALPSEAPAVSALSGRQDVGLRTSYGLEQIAAAPSAALLSWGRQRGLRLNAILHAAFLQALVAEGVLPPQTTATTVVNLRQLATPPLPWELMRLLRVCVDTPVTVDPEQPLAFLATQLHGQLQQLLQADAPLQALAAISAALADNPSPEQFWSRSWREGGLITNLGRVPVAARHGAFSLERLFFVANVEPIVLPDRPLVVLAALSFNGQLSLSSLQIEQQLSDQGAAAVMAAMKRRLLALL